MVESFEHTLKGSSKVFLIDMLNITTPIETKVIVEYLIRSFEQFQSLEGMEQYLLCSNYITEEQFCRIIRVYIKSKWSMPYTTKEVIKIRHSSWIEKHRDVCNFFLITRTPLLYEKLLSLRESNLNTLLTSPDEFERLYGKLLYEETKEAEE